MIAFGIAHKITLEENMAAGHIMAGEYMMAAGHIMAVEYMMAAEHSIIEHAEWCAIQDGAGIHHVSGSHHNSGTQYLCGRIHVDGTHRGSGTQHNDGAHSGRTQYDDHMPTEYNMVVESFYHEKDWFVSRLLVILHPLIQSILRLPVF